ncbi:hypothetical protein BU16DRAFT_536183 [Lophium mytilinum]|uniref:Uncharacterized protein n=1 Tax=Lophium mytilinum TaxID=390894 RepID=A0A6A6R7S1_9PEZI|nr:hypothetical protein BU16DRAFT_536183 [Lophium mytilinum]
MFFFNLQRKARKPMKKKGAKGTSRTEHLMISGSTSRTPPTDVAALAIQRKVSGRTLISAAQGSQGVNFRASATVTLRTMKTYKSPRARPISAVSMPMVQQHEVERYLSREARGNAPRVDDSTDLRDQRARTKMVFVNSRNPDQASVPSLPFIESGVR